MRGFTHVEAPQRLARFRVSQILMQPARACDWLHAQEHAVGVARRKSAGASAKTLNAAVSANAREMTHRIENGNVPTDVAIPRIKRSSS
jgi:hypothetical protein